MLPNEVVQTSRSAARNSIRALEVPALVGVKFSLYSTNFCDTVHINIEFYSSDSLVPSKL